MRLLAKLSVIGIAVMLSICGCSRQSDRLHVFISVSPQGDHDYAVFLNDWKALLKERGVAIEGAQRFPTKRQLKLIARLDPHNLRASVIKDNPPMARAA